MSALLSAEGVDVSFAGHPAPVAVLRGATLRLDPGELVVLSGPSGSGKSVLLDVLGGWAPPDLGTVRWGDADVPPDWGGLGIVPQALGLMPDLSVWHNLTLPLRLGSGGTGPEADAGRDRAEELLERLRLAHLRRRTPGEISLGEQQRLAVARAAVLGPQIVLADEPTSHQDSASSTAVLEMLREVCAAGGAVLVASHDEDVLRFAERRLRLHDGQVVDGW